MNPELREVMAALARIEKKVDAMAATPRAASAPTASGDVASDYELDSEYGNPVVKKDPPRWKGNSYAGSRMSECPADYLDVLAGLFDWRAGKDDEQGKTWTNKEGKEIPASTFSRKDAMRARGWAKRVREGKVVVTAPDDFSAPADDESLPF